MDSDGVWDGGATQHVTVPPVPLHCLAMPPVSRIAPFWNGAKQSQGQVGGPIWPAAYSSAPLVKHPPLQQRLRQAQHCAAWTLHLCSKASLEARPPHSCRTILHPGLNLAKLVGCNVRWHRYRVWVRWAAPGVTLRRGDTLLPLTGENRKQMGCRAGWKWLIKEVWRQAFHI